MHAILDQQKQLLHSLEDRMYTFQSPLFEASVGQHTRHSLDHLRKPLEAFAAANADASAPLLIRYDRRERNTAIETDRHAAIEQIETLQATIRSMGTTHSHTLSLYLEDGPSLIDRDAVEDQQVACKRVQAAFMLSASGQEFIFDSTLTREMAFSVHHCIHHNALSKVLLKHHFPQVQVPPSFGMAPSTLNFVATTGK